MRFVDTNVLIYSLGSDFGNEVKHQRAVDAIQEEPIALSVQVLQEFYFQATHGKRAAPMSHAEAIAFTRQLQEFPVQELTVSIFEDAAATAHRYKIAYWDVAIVEAARALGCRTVLTEDLQHGQNFSGVRIVNPFR